MLLAAALAPESLPSLEESRPLEESPPVTWPREGARSKAAAQESRCADCHFANLDAPARDHLHEWDLSAHGRNDVGCEACHGGDPSSFDPFVAHRNVLHSRNPASPTNAANLPRTCGLCHTGPFVAFQESAHFELLQEGDGRVPVCSTCHGSVGAHLLSPRALEARCAACHGPDGVAPEPGLSRQAREVLAQIHRIGRLLEQARALVERVDDERREDLEFALGQAGVPLEDAVDSAHSFRFSSSGERLESAQRRTVELLDRLLEESSPPQASSERSGSPEMGPFPPLPSPDPRR